MRVAIQSLAVIIFAVLLLTILVNGMKRRTLFFPSPYPVGPWDPQSYSVPPSDVWIDTPDGVRLHAWLFSSGRAGAALLVWYHGNGGNLSFRADVAAGFAQRGVDVLLFDYRGYGRSEGRPTEKALYVDSLAVYDYAIANGLADASRIVPYGESLGGPYSASVAARRPVRAVVIESSFASAASVANTVYGIPIGIFLGKSLPTADFLNEAGVPVLVMHGRADRVIPFACGRELYERIEGPKESFFTDLADHSGMSLEQEYYQRVIGFVDGAAGLAKREDSASP